MNIIIPTCERYFQVSKITAERITRLSTFTVTIILANQEPHYITTEDRINIYTIPSDRGLLRNVEEYLENCNIEMFILWVDDRLPLYI